MASKQITAEQLEEYAALEEQRKELDRQSRAIAKQQGILTAHFQIALEAAKKTTLSRGAYRVSLVESKCSVSYKDELTKVIGPLEVAKLAAEAPTKTKVVVEATQAAAVKKAA